MRPIVASRRLPLAVLIAVAVLMGGSALNGNRALSASSGQDAVRCWRGWGYWIDPQSRAYLGEELQLVTRGAVAWGAGRPVALFQLDRASGTISSGLPPIVIVPPLPRAHYNGQVNYVDGLARVEGRDRHLVFGLSEILPTSSPLPRATAFNRSLCGLR